MVRKGNLNGKYGSGFQTQGLNFGNLMFKGTALVRV